ncbi:MAG TPA: hypothetical protein EYP74_00765 [Anaerolineales bacterium]|nr:hypothetical protein [Anaerolineales bacterium]
MVNLVYLFWMFVIFFAAIGAMRGWAKELLVSFSMILALAVNFIIRKHLPIVRDLAVDSTSLFWIRSLITLALVYFGYQTVASLGTLAGKARKEKLQDALFGAVMGAFNGYLIVGTIWSYLHEANYPFDKIFSAAPPETMVEIARMMEWMPPYALGDPGIYFAVILSFIFVIIVYV